MCYRSRVSTYWIFKQSHFVFLFCMHQTKSVLKICFHFKYQRACYSTNHFPFEIQNEQFDDLHAASVAFIICILDNKVAKVCTKHAFSFHNSQNPFQFIPIFLVLLQKSSRICNCCNYRTRICELSIFLRGLYRTERSIQKCRWMEV